MCILKCCFMDPYGLAFVSHLANYNLGQWGPICIVFTIYLALDAKDVAAGWGGAVHT